MYEELVTRLQDFAAGTRLDEDAQLAFDAAEAIEILSYDHDNPLFRPAYWVPVSEKVPRLTGQYLVATKDGTVYAYWDWEEDQWYGLCGDPLQGVTFWMEFPEPPKEGE